MSEIVIEHRYQPTWECGRFTMETTIQVDGATDLDEAAQIAHLTELVSAVEYCKLLNPSRVDYLAWAMIEAGQPADDVREMVKIFRTVTKQKQK